VAEERFWRALASACLAPTDLPRDESTRRHIIVAERRVLLRVCAKHGSAVFGHAYGGEHLSVAASFYGLGNVYNGQGKVSTRKHWSTKGWGRIMSYLILPHPLAEVPGHQDQSFHQDSLLVAKIQEGMANMYADQGKYDQALDIYKSVLETRILVCGQDFPGVAMSKVT
jgi:hypothetical protein